MIMKATEEELSLELKFAMITHPLSTVQRCDRLLESVGERPRMQDEFKQVVVARS